MANSNEKLKSLSEIFTDTVNFVIPDYQRGYAWGKSQLDDLWEDLENLSETRNHYTGMFTFCKDAASEGSYQIVDGQQRMTTLIILINEMLGRIENGIQGGMSVEDYRKKYLYSKPFGALALKYKFQYSVDNPSDAFFKTKILGQSETGAFAEPEKTLYTRNLAFAKKYFKEKIEAYSQDDLAKLFKKVTERLVFNEYLIENVDDVYVTFETMNNRGKSLSKLELLKNRLIYLSTLYSTLAGNDTTQQDNVKTLRLNINNSWKTIYEYLGKSTKKLLKDDDFLRDHWIMYFRYDRSASNVFEKDLLSGHFIAKKVLSGGLSIQFVDKYVRSLQESIIVWFNINTPEESTLDETSKEWLVRLNRVGMGAFRPLLMAAFLRSPSTSKVELLKACERYNFLVMKITEKRSNTGDSFFYKKAHDYFVTTTPNESNLINEVNAKTNSLTNVRSFVTASIERYQKAEGFYSWGGVRYFLYEYEKHLQAGSETKVEWKTIQQNQENKVTIEHVLPQTPDDPYWQSRFSDTTLVHSLGNLLLLSRSKNSSLQNDSFEKKKKTIRDENGNVQYSGYDSGSYSEIEVARYEEWTPETIEERGRQMIKFLKQHWGLNYEFTEEDTKNLLNLNGVEAAQVTEESLDTENSLDELENVDETED